MDIIAFVEHLGVELWPVQRFILKAMYGLPLDEDTESIEVPSSWRKESSTWMSETQYLAYLFQKGQATSPGGSGEPPEGVVLVMGRRSGKSFLAGLVGLYETYRMVSGENPNTTRLLPNQTHGTMVLGPTKDMGLQPYTYMVDLVPNAPLLQERMANWTQSYVRFQNDNDIDQSGPWKGSRRQARASVDMRVVAANPRSLRGHTLGFAVLDEADYLAKSSVDAVFDSVQSSLAVLSGKWLLSSSPMMESVFLRKWFDRAMTSGGRMLALQIPTWEANPTFMDLESHYERGPLAFHVEFGAMFMRTVELHIPLTLCNEVESYLPDNEDINSFVVGQMTEWVSTRR